MTQQIIGASRQSQRSSGAAINANFTELYNLVGSNLANIATKIVDYTLVLADSALVIRMNSATALNLTLPNNLPAGFQVAIIQSGAGQVNLIAASGAVINSRTNITKTAGQHAILSLLVTLNTSGTTANYNVSGDGTA